MDHAGAVTRKGSAMRIFRLDAMTTGAAVRTYNVMLMESRRVGAGLIAVD